MRQIVRELIKDAAMRTPDGGTIVVQVLSGPTRQMLRRSKGLALNPVLIFIWLIFCGWIWGITGALLAVPLLAIVKIICDQVEQLAPLGEFLGTESKIATS